MGLASRLLSFGGGFRAFLLAESQAAEGLAGQDHEDDGAQDERSIQRLLHEPGSDENRGRDGGRLAGAQQ